MGFVTDVCKGQVGVLASFGGKQPWECGEEREQGGSRTWGNVQGHSDVLDRVASGTQEVVFRSYMLIFFF